MTSKDIAIKVENISKLYRIGMKEQIHDSFGSAIFDFIKSPLTNYRKYRSLYKFDDISPDAGSDSNSNSSDIIWALKGVSFDVKRGEVLGIIGRNGAGKSTLLKIFSRVTDPTTGYVQIRGRVSSLLEVGTGFHPELTGRENVYLNGTILGMKKTEIDAKFQDIVSFSGIEKFIDTPVKRYSSGMTVRLAFSVAAHLEPEILVIDEVLAVGDAEFQKKCLKKMDDVGKEGRTVLFVSHNMPAITRLCSRAILIDHGEVIDDGPSRQVVSAYLNSDLGTSAAREWREPETAPTGDVARLRAVRVRAEDGRITESVDIQIPFTIEMEYDVLKPGYKLSSHFGIINENGDVVFVTIDLDPDWRKRPRPTGRYSSKVWVPGNLLSEGMLYVHSHLLTEAPDTVQFSVKPAVAFQVVDNLEGNSARGDYGQSFPGVVRPLLKWKTELCKTDDTIAWLESETTLR